MLCSEAEAVRESMGHGDVTQEGYTAVWEECYREVLFIPSQNRYIVCVCIVCMCV